ncbi:MAG: Lrp/AsnC ligand binding domain-containing protein [Thaumarchaeota archaeon]|nr:Lrp/AsnC ligand binding domain-containing protein [Nitrososphaerota archaeon]
MAKAYVLINTEMGKEEDVLKELKQLPYVTEAYMIYGVYDIIAKVEADSLERVKETISSRVRRLEHVRSTLSIIVIE